MANNIVFVIGAGASKEYGFPTGMELIPMIRTYLTDIHGEENSRDNNIGEKLSETIKT